MTTLHIITHSLPPSPGGLEEWTLNIAKLFSSIGYSVILYTMDEIQDSKYYENICRKNISIRLISTERQAWEQPLYSSIESLEKLSQERQRLNFVIVKNWITSKMGQDVNSSHIIISNSITAPGFLGALLSEELGIPHVSVASGTDFSRGFRSSRERYIIEKVIEHSSYIITKNKEQEQSLSRYYRVNNIRTIHTSVHTDVLSHSWEGVDNNTLSLISDNGYSHKKGTQVLMSAYRTLVQENFPITLTICGTIIDGQDYYWQNLKKQYIADTPGIKFHNRLPREQIWDIISHSTIYCSPTLGEGSSHARAAALCIGIPIVTTDCGEISDIARCVDHVRLSNVADASSFLKELRQLCHDIKSGMCKIDNDAILRWREYFSSKREFEQWQSLVKEIE